MNPLGLLKFDDLLCVGVVERILVSSTINRNAKRRPGAVVSALIKGTEEALQILRDP